MVLTCADVSGLEAGGNSSNSY